MLDLECFVISGLKAKGTSAAVMAFLFTERHKENCVYDYPIGGTQVRPGQYQNHSALYQSPVSQIKSNHNHILRLLTWRMPYGASIKPHRRVSKPGIRD